MVNLRSALEGLSSVDHRATTLLRREHESIRAAFRTYHATSPLAHEALERIAHEIAWLIELEDGVDRNVVYPALEPYFPPLIRALTVEHDELLEQIGTVRACARHPAQLAAAVARLEALVHHHLAQEASALLAVVEQDEPGLNRWLYDAVVREKERLVSRAFTRERQG